ncbi:class I SAM-dependent methyltransferase [Pseudanabaena sp. ABRG5-3]|uniref:class I SAM-dependent methyltransferase n=1 Tax=Pseudanabaena sp. ABRG5-3 TaxID=685565 RepID=UPI000DC6EF4C|nr:class I SAM-dependent methyltransferase [Pseudanabaena sp. ABRG5-3]BBC23241.1 methylase involved in ubiquinone/menaquinone biosynthesis [Pseudanabaena sp. ABRG5-3]
MTTILRDWSYQYQWFYDTVSALAAVSVGGEKRFRKLFLKDLQINPEAKVLDLCCGAGQATQELVKHFSNVTGLDASPIAIKRAKQNVPQAEYVEAFAEKMPFSDRSFDLVITSTAMHEMEPEQLQQIIQEVYRILTLEGQFIIIDFHRPTNPLFWLPIATFLWLFETETAWQLLKTDLQQLLSKTGFKVESCQLYAGGSLQVLRSRKVL